MNKKTILFAFVLLSFVLALNFVSAALCRGDSGYYYCKTDSYSYNYNQYKTDSFKQVIEHKETTESRDSDYFAELASTIEPRLIVPEEVKFDEDLLLSSLKTSKMFDAWMNEKTEDYLMENFGVAPGEFRVKAANADWLLYSLQEMSVLTSNSGLHKPLQLLRVRIKHGAKEKPLTLF